MLRVVAAENRGQRSRTVRRFREPGGFKYVRNVMLLMRRM